MVDLKVESKRQSIYERLGGEGPVRALAQRFYDCMESDEPALAALHEHDGDRIGQGIRERFGTFLCFWLGGPQTYIEKHGHPRLRMRHAPFPVDVAMRDAWLRAMNKAVDEKVPDDELRKLLKDRFAEVADFLRNRPG